MPPDFIPLLTHGYVKFIESWGSDESIIEAARMSTNKGFLGWEPGICPTCHGTWADPDCVPVPVPGTSTVTIKKCPSCNGKGTIPGDRALLRSLWEEDPKHTTPFEMAGAIFEIQAPIFVFREWHRHRTQSYNEMSARYTPLPNYNYIPSVERLLLNSKTNKQAGVIQGADELTETNAILFQDCLLKMYDEQERLYQAALKYGVPKELARIHLPVGRFSRMRASTNLRNWLHFLSLRDHPKAQWEIRQYAEAVCEFLAKKFPNTLSLFMPEQHARWEKSAAKDREKLEKKARDEAKLREEYRNLG